MSSVTAIELHAGTRSREQALTVEQVVQSFARSSRLLTPLELEWIAAGRLIARAISRYGAMEPRDHYPDVLIALAADRIGATIVTENVADFDRWILLGKLDATVTPLGPMILNG